MAEDTWKTEEHETCWTRRWIRYDSKGKAVGCNIIVRNPTQELIQAIERAWHETEGKFAR